MVRTVCLELNEIVELSKLTVVEAHATSCGADGYRPEVQHQEARLGYMGLGTTCEGMALL